jgi:hypothetical protein
MTCVINSTSAARNARKNIRAIARKNAVRRISPCNRHDKNPSTDDGYNIKERVCPAFAFPQGKRRDNKFSQIATGKMDTNRVFLPNKYIDPGTMYRLSMSGRRLFFQ